MKIFTVILVLVLPIALRGQYYKQYFDGADTLQSSIKVEIDTSISNIWQIGKPQKAIFDTAASIPNVIITDTVNFYPPNNTSGFTITIPPDWYDWGIFALQWTQKLDMDTAMDGGVVEFSTDSGQTWQNPISSGFTYNWYGYDTANIDTLPSGDIGFTGTDSTWKDIWLCFDYSWMRAEDGLLIRFTFQSDANDENKEGWMMDNFTGHITIIHTVGEEEQEEYLKIYPNSTTGKVNIQAKKLEGFHVIEHMELINLEGRLVRSFGVCPTKFSFDIGGFPAGMYYLKVTTNHHTETFPILLQSP